jgi:hypothetical protein
MKRTWWLRGLKLALFVVVALAVVGVVVMALWNWLLPGLFGWPAIDFWQALGLLLLSNILLGGLRGGGARRMYWRARMRERWEQMTEEERERFRQGCAAAAAAGPKASPRPECRARESGRAIASAHVLLRV